MNIMMWAGLCVLVAYNGNAELATLGVMLLTIVWAANKKWCRFDVERTWDAAPAGAASHGWSPDPRTCFQNHAAAGR